MTEVCNDLQNLSTSRFKRYLFESIKRFKRNTGQGHCVIPGRYFPVGHQVGGHHLYDHLEGVGYSPIDAGRWTLTDLGSDSILHHYDFWSSEDSHYFDCYRRSPLSEIGGDLPENRCFDWMIVLPVPSCGLPNDQILRCNHCFDHVTGSR